MKGVNVSYEFVSVIVSVQQSPNEKVLASHAVVVEILLHHDRTYLFQHSQHSTITQQQILALTHTSSTLALTDADY
jgi:hypothetical protein